MEVVEGLAWYLIFDRENNFLFAYFIISSKNKTKQAFIYRGFWVPEIQGLLKRGRFGRLQYSKSDLCNYKLSLVFWRFGTELVPWCWHVICWKVEKRHPVPESYLWESGIREISQEGKSHLCLSLSYSWEAAGLAQSNPWIRREKKLEKPHKRMEYFCLSQGVNLQLKEPWTFPSRKFYLE